MLIGKPAPGSNFPLRTKKKKQRIGQLSLSNLQPNEADEISAEIAEIEGLICERVTGIITALKKGFDVSEDEQRVMEMRSVLEALRARRKRILQAPFVVVS
jgi:hypothetical protein